eukprot:1585538-Amphidinium_carterae.1
MWQLLRGNTTEKQFCEAVSDSLNGRVKAARLESSAKWLSELKSLGEIQRVVKCKQVDNLSVNIGAGNSILEERRVQSMISCMVKYAAQPTVGDSTAKMTMRMGQLYITPYTVCYGDICMWHFSKRCPMFDEDAKDDDKIFIGIGLAYGIRDLIQQESLNMPTTSQIGRTIPCITNAFADQKLRSSLRITQDVMIIPHSVESAANFIPSFCEVDERHWSGLSRSDQSIKAKTFFIPAQYLDDNGYGPGGEKTRTIIQHAIHEMELDPLNRAQHNVALKAFSVVRTKDATAVIGETNQIVWLYNSLIEDIQETTDSRIIELLKGENT